MAETLSFPGRGGVYQASVVRPSDGRGPAVVLVAPLGSAREALGPVLAHQGLMAAWLEPAGASAEEQAQSVLDVDNLAALAGTLFARSGSPGPAVGVLAFGPGVWPALTLARSLPDLVAALVVFSDEALDKGVLDIGVPVQAHLREAAAQVIGAGKAQIELVAHASVPTVDNLVADAGGAGGPLHQVVTFMSEHRSSSG